MSCDVGLELRMCSILFYLHVYSHDFYHLNVLHLFAMYYMCHVSCTMYKAPMQSIVDTQQ